MKKKSKQIPPCAAAMGCLCAGHARGNPATAPCDTSETPPQGRKTRSPMHIEISGDAKAGEQETIDVTSSGDEQCQKCGRLLDSEGECRAGCSQPRESERHPTNEELLRLVEEAESLMPSGTNKRTKWRQRAAAAIAAAHGGAGWRAR